MNKNASDVTSGEAGRGPASAFHRTDVAVAAVLLALVAFLYWTTFSFDEIPASLAQNVQPTLFPRLVLLFIALAALALPFEHIVKRRQGIDVDQARRTPPKPIVYVTAVAMFVFVAAMMWIGTYLALIALAGVLPALWGERRLKLLIPYALIFPTVVMWFFAGVLEVTFLQGPLGQVFR